MKKHRVTRNDKKGIVLEDEYLFYIILEGYECIYI